MIPDPKEGGWSLFIDSAGGIYVPFESPELVYALRHFAARIECSIEAAEALKLEALQRIEGT